jgi:hypothetical protein
MGEVSAMVSGVVSLSGAGVDEAGAVVIRKSISRSKAL